MTRCNTHNRRYGCSLHMVVAQRPPPTIIIHMSQYVSQVTFSAHPDPATERLIQTWTEHCRAQLDAPPPLEGATSEEDVKRDFPTPQAPRSSRVRRRMPSPPSEEEDEKLDAYPPLVGNEFRINGTPVRLPVLYPHQEIDGTVLYRVHPWWTSLYRSPDFGEEWVETVLDEDDPFADPNGFDSMIQ